MDRPYKLLLSVGAAVYDPQRPCSIDDLLVEAGESMRRPNGESGEQRGR